MVQFAQLNYLPTLLLRQAELTAIQKLGASEKDALFPLVRLRPWKGKKGFERSIEKVEEAFGDRPFACDLDDWYSPDEEKTSNARVEFDQLRAERNFAGWYDMVMRHPQAIPCIRLEASAEDIRKVVQKDWIAERGFGVVLSKSNTAHHDKILGVMAAVRHSNYFVVVETGWSKDPLLEAAWASAVALKAFDANPGVSLFVSAATFPAVFGEIGVDEVIPMPEYSLHAAVARAVALKHNDAFVRYADWATTRPPSNGGGGGWVPRLDVPEARQIRVFRSRVDEASGQTKESVCAALARLIVARREWPTPPPSWGHYSVDMTATGSANGIYHQGTNTAARINMYLHQMIAATGPRPASLEEPFEG